MTKLSQLLPLTECKFELDFAPLGLVVVFVHGYLGYFWKNICY